MKWLKVICFVYLCKNFQKYIDMGRAKNIMMEEMENPFINIPKHNVSANLFGNELIRKYIYEKGCPGICYYTKERDIVMPLNKILEYINMIVFTYYGDPDNEGLGWSSSFDDEDIGQAFHKELGGYIVPEGRIIYEDISDLFEANGLDIKSEELRNYIVDVFNDTRLIRKDPYGLTEDEERILSWEYVAQNAIKMYNKGISLNEITIKEHTRLYELLVAIQSAPLPLLGKIPLKLYRCVHYKDKKTHTEFSDLTSPPVKYTRNLRMSANGDSVFYGSCDKGTAIEEAIKDKGDDYIYVGTFETLHDVNVLDLSGIPDKLSIFNQTERDYYVLLFLKMFCKEISKPILTNSDSPQEYIPTQLMTYYFRNTLKLYNQSKEREDLNGILYTSSKNPNHTNVVLFYNNEDSAQHLKLIEYDVIHLGMTEHYEYP